MLKIEAKKFKTNIYIKIDSQKINHDEFEEKWEFCSYATALNNRFTFYFARLLNYAKPPI